MSASSRRIDRLQATFDHGGIVANAGLVVSATLMVRLGLEALIDAWVKTGSSRPGRKVLTLVAAMLAGATHIDHVNVLRAGATQRVLPFKVMAPSTIGSFLSRARQIAPNINEVIADRAYTVKREDFVRPLRRLGINVVMDYAKTMVQKPKGTTLGRRRQNVIMYCGTILLDGIPKNMLTPPKYLLRKGKEQKLEEWHNERARLYRWSSKGPAAGGGRRFQSPVRARRVAAPHGPSPNSYSMPMVAASTAGPAGNLSVVNARVEQLDTYQEHPWGTTVWRISYGRRSVVEGVFGRLKANKGLGGEACKAFGLAANTLAALNVGVAFNRKRARVAKLRRRRAKALASEHSADSDAKKSAASDQQPPDSPAGGGEPPTSTNPALRAPP